MLEFMKGKLPSILSLAMACLARTALLADVPVGNFQFQVAMRCPEYGELTVNCRL